MNAPSDFKILHRSAQDDYFAFLIANAMQEAGVEVFSISFNREKLRFGAMEPSARFLVWCKYPKLDGDAWVTRIDTAINKVYEDAAMPLQSA
jgi:hypothetical protein